MFGIPGAVGVHSQSGDAQLIGAQSQVQPVVFIVSPRHLTGTGL
ncbi:hypothetical protein ACFONI_13835 [Aeromonas media]